MLPPAAAAAAAALAAVGAAAVLLRLALRHSQLARRHSAALSAATRLACGLAILLLQLEAPPAGSGALAVASATVLHPEALLLLARMLLLPLPLEHRLWVQTAEIRAALARMARQPASTACCDFVSAARRALDTLAAHGAPQRPTPLGPPPTATQCCWMAHTFVVLLIGVLTPAALALARAQRADAWAAWVQAAMLQRRGGKRGSSSSRGYGDSPKSSPGYAGSRKSSPADGGSSPSSTHQSARDSSVADGSLHSTSPSGSSGSSGNLLPEGSPVGSESNSMVGSESRSTASTASLDQPGLASGGSGEPAVEGISGGDGKPAAAAGRRRRRSSSPALLGGMEDPSPRDSNGSPRSPSSELTDGGRTLAGLPATLLAAPLPLAWLQSLFFLLPACAALWAALEVAVNAQAA